MTPTRIARSARITEKIARPELTALVDLITILLVFLLKSFSVDGNFTQVNDEIHLPTSDKADRGRSLPTLQITPDEVLFNGSPVAVLSDRSDEGEVLTAALTSKRQEMTGQLAGDASLQENNSPGGDALLIQCDRNHDFQVLGQVLRACSAAGFTDLSLVTQTEGS